MFIEPLLSNQLNQQNQINTPTAEYPSSGLQQKVKVEATSPSLEQGSLPWLVRHQSKVSNTEETRKKGEVIKLKDNNNTMKKDEVENRMWNLDPRSGKLLGWSLDHATPPHFNYNVKIFWRKKS